MLDGGTGKSLRTAPAVMGLSRRKRCAAPGTDVCPSREKKPRAMSRRSTAARSSYDRVLRVRSMACAGTARPFARPWLQYYDAKGSRKWDVADL